MKTNMKSWGIFEKLVQNKEPIFALSSGMERLSAELSTVNLMDCHKINSMHLCEEHGVLNKNLNSTCLGSLYQQDFAGAMALCEMEITTQKETVLPLRDNWYLVHSPRQFTGHITCRNDVEEARVLLVADRVTGPTGHHAVVHFRLWGIFQVVKVLIHPFFVSVFNSFTQKLCIDLYICDC